MYISNEFADEFTSLSLSFSLSLSQPTLVPAVYLIFQFWLGQGASSTNHLLLCLSPGSFVLFVFYSVLVYLLHSLIEFALVSYSMAGEVVAI